MPETVTKESVEQRIKGEVDKYKKASKRLIEKGDYRRGRNYQEGSKEDLYLLKSDGRVDCIAYNCTHHRTQRVISAFLTNKLADVPSYVLTNYVTNGYNTRRGLFANYETKRERMERISRSHADYMGNEVSSSIDHQQRVSMRN